jgi:signal transduction histidine kinase
MGLRRTPGGLARRLWASLAGRLVVLLTVGMALVASVSLLVAQNAHRRNLAELRLDSVVGTVEDVANQYRLHPDVTQKMLAAGMVRHTRLPHPGWNLSKPSPRVTAALRARLGPRAQALGQVQPHEYCFAPNGMFHDAEAQLTWPAEPDCWLIRFIDGRGQERMLTISLPRYLIGTPDLVDPLYLALIVVMSAALASLVAWFSVKPLRQLARATQAFSLVDEPTFLAETGPQEVRTAIATFNLMQRRVVEGHRERTGMLAAISHDLQTPLTRLQLRLDELADNPVLAPAHAQLMADLSIMQGIVRDGLALARSSDSREPWSSVDIDSLLASIAADAVDMGAQVEIGATCGLAIPTRIDAMTRCVTNLVDNAVKYAGAAQIDCVGGVGRLDIRIADRGPGIPPQDLERMFEPFARGEQSRSRATGGTGLGLTIARAQARLFRGEVFLENREGGGTLATLRIALEPAPDPAR